MNKVILVGRLTKEPELRTAASGVSVASFTVAVNRRFKNAEGNYDADFINCIAWRNTADFIAKSFGKGKQIGIVGSIQTRNYEKDGKKVYVTEVAVDETYFCGDKPKAAEKPKNEPNYVPSAKDGFVSMGNDDPLPF